MCGAEQLALACGRAPGNDWTNFHLVLVIQHFVFGDEIVAFDHEMRFDDEIQFAQEIFNFFGTFDFDGSGWMAQLDLHERMIRLALEGLQECIQVSAVPDPECFASES